MSALLLAAILGTGRKSCVAFSAHRLVTVECLGQKSQRRVVHTPTQTQHQVKGGFLLNIVVRKSTSIFQLLSSENQTLLIRGNSLLVLNLGLDIVNGVRGFDIKGDGLTREGLYEDLHGERKDNDFSVSLVRARDEAPIEALRIVTSLC